MRETVEGESACERGCVCTERGGEQACASCKRFRGGMREFFLLKSVLLKLEGTIAGLSAANETPSFCLTSYKVSFVENVLLQLDIQQAVDFNT